MSFLGKFFDYLGGHPLQAVVVIFALVVLAIVWRVNAESTAYRNSRGLTVEENRRRKLCDFRDNTGDHIFNVLTRMLEGNSRYELLRSTDSAGVYRITVMFKSTRTPALRLWITADADVLHYQLDAHGEKRNWPIKATDVIMVGLAGWLSSQAIDVRS